MLSIQNSYMSGKIYECKISSVKILERKRKSLMQNNKKVNSRDYISVAVCLD